VIEPNAIAKLMSKDSNSTDSQ